MNSKFLWVDIQYDKDQSSESTISPQKLRKSSVIVLVETNWLFNHLPDHTNKAIIQFHNHAT